MRVHELAKELNVTSKDLLARLKTLKIAAKSHASALTAEDVARVRAAKTRVSTAAPKVVKTAAKPVMAIPPKPNAVTAPTKPGTPLQAGSAKGVSPSVGGRPSAPPKPVAPLAPLKAATTVVAPPKPKPAQPAAPIAVKPAPKPVPKPVVAPPPPPPKPEPAVPVVPKRLELRFPITVKELAEKMEVKASDVIKHLMQQGVFASMTQQLNEATATKVAQAFHCDVLPQPTLEEQILKQNQPDPKRLLPRAPVVTFMGHVDHGKTSLLDAIRQAKVAEKEAGGITQHIGAYEVQLEKGHVTFLDTPGHEAFSALRARGANVTDVVVLVVAADDGVMPQTAEAIDHAKAADVPIVVAINKIDKPEANPQKVKQQLTEYGLIAEEWGGKTIMVPVSAKTRQGIDDLLEMLLLEAELLELKADPMIPAQGTVIEAKLTKDRGPVTTVLVQQGTLRLGEPILIGTQFGRVRAMVDDRGHRVKEAGPARPVEVLGLPEVPKAGDRFLVITDEKLARQLVEQRQKRQPGRGAAAHPRHISLEELHQRIAEGKLKDLRLILKADVQGSLEAITQSLQKLDLEKEEVQFKILHSGVGDISESDVILAAASEAIVIGFHVGIAPQVQVLAANEGVDIRIYQIIYELTNAIKAAIEGLLEPTIEENFLGRAEVRKLFQVSKAGIVAGCMVVKGAFRRDCTVRVIRGKDRIYEGKVASLRRVKDDVREVQEGQECGIVLEGSTDLQPGDLLEAWEMKKVARKLA
jgi:translation initiation factor IF-2